MPRNGGAYLRLYQKLRGQIIGGLYPYGARFPSKRVTAEENGVSLVTAEHAYAILVEEGYLVARERSGFFVDYRESDLMPVAAGAPAPGRSAPVSDPAEAFPFAQYARVVRHVLSAYRPLLLARSPGEGIPELRQAIASYLALSRHITVSPQQIVIGSGAEYLYSLVVQLLGRDSIYAVESPCYEMIRMTYQLQGVTVDPLPLTTDGIASHALEATSAGVLHVTPFRSYPSGITASAGKRAEYIRWARSRDAFLIEDDYESAFSPSSKAEDTLYALDPDGRVIYINTFSRTVAPSIRVGYMVLPPGLTDLYAGRLGFMSCSVPVLEQCLLTELLVSGDFERHINRVRRRRRKTAQGNVQEPPL